MRRLIDQLLDLVDLLNMEPQEDELSFEFFSRAVCVGLEKELLTPLEYEELAQFCEAAAG